MLTDNATPGEFGSWTALTRADQIAPGQGRCFVLGGNKIAIFRGRDGQVYALDAVCPHRGGPLNDGLADRGVVVCPLHGYKFSLIDGRGQDNDLSVRCHPVEVRDEIVYVRL